MLFRSLLDSSLSGIPSYYISMKLDKHWRKFFFGIVKATKGNIIWLNGGRICRSKRKGGLGVKDLHKQNLSILCKWWWKLETQSGLW